MENIGNIPNLSAEMENDVSLMADFSGTQLHYSNWTETISNNASTYNYYLLDTINFTPSPLNGLNDYDPLKQIKMVFSAPQTIKLSGDRGYDSTFSVTMKYVGCKIPYCFSLETVAYRSLGERVSVEINNAEIFGMEKRTTIHDVYTFNYMEFTFNQQLLNKYNMIAQIGGDMPTDMWDGGENPEFRIIYACDATNITKIGTKTNDYVPFNE